MICEICKIDKPLKDFLRNQTHCYKCEYAKKIEKQKKHKEKKLCRICGEEIIFNEQAKKRQRTVFCSLECAETGHDILKNEYWVRKIKLKESYHGQ